MSKRGVGAGELNRRIRLERLIQTRSPLGEVIESWALVAVVWAQVLSLSGREWHEARQLPEGEVSTAITIRYRPDVERTMRVVHGDTVLTIEAVLDKDGRRRMLQLMCRERV